MEVTITTWLALLAFVFAMLLLDLFLHRSHQEIKFKEAAIWSTIWVICGLGVGAVIWIIYGGEFGLQYLSGYVIEKDRKSTRLNSSHSQQSRMPSSA